jgi:hypothetical protein
VLAGDAAAAPYLKVQGENMIDSTTTTVDTTDNGFSYTTFQRDGYAYSWAPVKNAGWLRIRARSNGCGDGTFARLIVSVGRAGTVFDQQLTGSWAYYTTPGFVIDQTGTGSARVIVAATQTGGGGACTKQVRLDVVEFYVWRPFSPGSLWNKKAVDIASPPGSQTGIQSGPGAWMAPGQVGLRVGGCPDGSADCSQDRPFNKPICFGESDQSTAVSGTGPAQTQVRGNIAYAAQAIPRASPCGAATGSDGHLVVTDPGRSFSYEWWHCVVTGLPCGPSAGYGVGTDGLIARWNLTGDGVANAQDGVAPTCCPNWSARGAGTPVINTAIRGEEAVNGIEHAIGCSITSPGSSDVSNKFLYPPATNTDGILGSGGSRYGELYTLRSDFLLSHPTNPTRGRAWSTGELNIINALMTYGCYLVDRHGGFELDTDASSWTQADWTAADVTKASLNSIQPTDMRYRAISSQTEYLDGQ